MSTGRGLLQERSRVQHWQHPLGAENVCRLHPPTSKLHPLISTHLLCTPPLPNLGSERVAALWAGVSVRINRRAVPRGLPPLLIDRPGALAAPAITKTLTCC